MGNYLLMLIVLEVLELPASVHLDYLLSSLCWFKLYAFGPDIVILCMAA